MVSRFFFRFSGSVFGLSFGGVSGSASPNQKGLGFCGSGCKARPNNRTNKHPQTNEPQNGMSVLVNLQKFFHITIIISK